jgi:hypothetical protein
MTSTERGLRKLRDKVKPPESPLTVTTLNQQNPSPEVHQETRLGAARIIGLSDDGCTESLVFTELSTH